MSPYLIIFYFRAVPVLAKLPPAFMTALAPIERRMLTRISKYNRRSVRDYVSLRFANVKSCPCFFLGLHSFPPFFNNSFLSPCRLNVVLKFMFLIAVFAFFLPIKNPHRKEQKQQ